LFLLAPPSQAQDSPQYCVATDGGKTVCGKLKKVERMCVTTNGSNSICGKFKGTEEEREASKPPQRSDYRKELDGFVYTLDGCKKADGNIRCSVTVTNKGKIAKEISISKSTLVDSTGRSREAWPDLGGSTLAVITPGVDAYITILFDKIPDGALKVDLLSIPLPRQNKSIQFRNIPLSN
jgi:hypothetical protein